jgi:hypothetical protein
MLGKGGGGVGGLTALRNTMNIILIIYIFTHLTYFFLPHVIDIPLDYRLKPLFLIKLPMKGNLKEDSFFLFIEHTYILNGLPNGDFYAGKYSRAHHFAAIFQFFFLGRPTTPPHLWASDTPYYTLPHSSLWESQV